MISYQQGFTMSCVYLSRICHVYSQSVQGLLQYLLYKRLKTLSAFLIFSICSVLCLWFVLSNVCTPSICCILCSLSRVCYSTFKSKTSLAFSICQHFSSLVSRVFWCLLSSVCLSRVCHVQYVCVEFVKVSSIHMRHF